VGVVLEHQAAAHSLRAAALAVVGVVDKFIQTTKSQLAKVRQ
jgi:hypothetical protein